MGRVLWLWAALAALSGCYLSSPVEPAPDSGLQPVAGEGLPPEPPSPMDGGGLVPLPDAAFAPPDAAAPCARSLEPGCECLLGAIRACYSGSAGTRAVGLCRDGAQRCEPAPGGARWSDACEGEGLPAVRDGCSAGDEDCDGQLDEDCNGLSCPGDTTTPAGSPVSLAVDARGFGALAWSVVGAPTGGEATAQWSPSPPARASVSFTPFIVGSYTIQVSGVDREGRVVACDFSVTALPHGLRVQLTWDGDGDLDLHLLRDSAMRWFDPADDCFFSNTSTSWGAELDFDNTQRLGPENIRIDNPELDAAYTIGVHNYSAGGGRRATVAVFCGDTGDTTPELTLTSRPLSGDTGGTCTDNDFWRVARVSFADASSCHIESLDSYITAADACLSR